MERLAATWADGWQDALAAWRPTAILAAPDGVPGALLGPLAALARRTGAAFLAARAHGELVFKGPLAAAPGPRVTTACPQCLRLQLADHAEDSLAAHVLRDGEVTADRMPYRPGPAGDRAPLTPLLAAAVASELAMDLLKHLAGAVEPDLAGAVVVQRTDTLETWREALPRRSDCPACRRPEESRLEEFREGGLDLPGSPGERLSRYTAALGPATGILRAFDDADGPRTPLWSGRIRTGAVVGPARHGFSVATPAEARARAAEQALREAAYRAPAPLRVRHATEAQLRATGAEPAPGGPEVAISWTPALRLGDGAAVWVPLDRALTGGDGGRAVGVGAGATVREVVEGALASTLLDERLRDWLDGVCVPEPVDASAELDAPHASLARYLLGTGALTLCALPPVTPYGFQVALARHQPQDGAGPSQVAAAGATRRAAVATALRELAGLAAHPEAATGAPAGSHHVVCPPHWPAAPGRPMAPAELPDPADPEPLADLAGPADTEAPAGLAAPAGPEALPVPAEPSAPADLSDLLGLVPPGRDVLLVRLAPAGLPRTPAGGPVVLAGRVLLVDTPAPALPPEDQRSGGA
ncbi:hypothetical protein SAVIM338S_06839 [Streptomyces avidinii]